MSEMKEQHTLLLLNEITSVRERIVKEKKGDTKRIKKQLKKCEAIERYLLNVKLSKDEIVKYKYKIIALEREVDESESDPRKSLITWIISVGVFTIIINYIINDNLDIRMFLSNYLGLFLFILIGVTGAVTKFLLDEYRRNKEPSDQILIALTFPIIFINLFIYDEGQIKGVIIVNLLMFVCGFSVEFILLFLNRLVDVAKKAFNLEEDKRTKESNEELEIKESVENK